MAKRIYISPENRPGPHGPYTGYPGVYEHDVCNEIAALLKSELERNGFEAVIADPKSTLAQRIAWANANRIDYYTTLHTNAGGGTGAEVYYYDYPVSKKACQQVYDELVALYPSKRGIKSGMHFAEVTGTVMVSVYPELAFHDNAADAKFLVENKPEIAAALCRGVCRYYDVAYIPAEAPLTSGEAASTAQSAENHRLRTENGRLQQDVIDLNAQISKLEAQLERVREIVSR